MTEKYKKASKTYIYFISIFTILLSFLFIYMLHVSGKDLIRNGLFWSLVLLILVSLWGLIFAKRITSGFIDYDRFPEEKARKKWHTSMIPAYILIIGGFLMINIFSRADSSKIWILISLFISCSGLVILGSFIIKTGVFYSGGLHRRHSWFSKVVGFALLTIGIALFVGYVLLLIITNIAKPL